MTTTRPIAESNVKVDFSKHIGKIKALHSVNRGPIGSWGAEDHSEFYKKARFPHARLHDCPLHMMDTVDIHLIFPNWDADENDPANYRFAATDRYIQATLETGAEIVYRLGESIEHYAVKTYIFPPKDYDKWARICLNIIRHYNHGWANGFEHNIRFWEIWNEPDLTEKMWSGTAQQYYELYAVVSKAIKAEFPELLVGGPGLAMPSIHKPWPQNFLAYCRDHALPMDFFSWHRYSCRPEELVEMARNIRAALDEYGYTQTQSHLNEWHYLPFQDWSFIKFGTPNNTKQTADHEVDLFKAKMAMEAAASHEAAAFTASSLIRLQDEPVDAAMYYVGNAGRLGLFDLSGGAPRGAYFALETLGKMVDMQHRVWTDASEDAVSCLASVDSASLQATVMISRFDAGCYGDLVIDLDNLPWTGPTRCEQYVIDSQRRYQHVERRTFDSPCCHFHWFIEPTAILICNLSPA